MIVFARIGHGYLHGDACRKIESRRKIMYSVKIRLVISFMSFKKLVSLFRMMGIIVGVFVFPVRILS